MKIHHHEQEVEDEEKSTVRIAVRMSRYEVTPWLTFKNMQEREQFSRSFRHETPLVPLLAVLACCTLFMFVTIVRFIFSATGLANVVIISVLVLSSLLVVLARFFPPSQKYGNILPLAEEAWAMILCLCCGGALVLRTSWQCNSYSKDLIPSQNCESGEILLPTENILFLALAPIFLDNAVPSLRWMVAMSCWLICSSFLVGVTIAYGARNSVQSVIGAVVISFGSLVSKRYNRLHAFRKLHTSVEEKDKNMRQDFERVRQETAISDANEWRSIVANIAHDLKTPVTAMSVGCDLLLSLISDVSRLSMQYNVYIHQKSDLATLSTTVSSMQHSCAFMTMMIHRYVDFTKTSHGLPLVPRLEPVQLLDVILSGPVACVQDLTSAVPSSLAHGLGQSLPESASGIGIRTVEVGRQAVDHRSGSCRGKITILPVSSEIGCVLTDKQWLEENILCLLSNALKYSENQVVTLQLSLVREDELPSLGAPVPKVQTMRDGEHETRDLDTSITQRLHVRVEVADLGVGISEADRSSLFEPTCQIQRKSGGTGLGLYSLANRTVALGGRYGVTERADRHSGAVFWFTFPCVKYGEEEWQQQRRGEVCYNMHYYNTLRMAPPTQHAMLPAGTTAQGMCSYQDSFHSSHPSASVLAKTERLASLSMSTKEAPQAASLYPTWLSSQQEPSLVRGVRRTRRVLVVDDSLLVLRMVSRMLEKAGYVVDEVENGRDAVKLMLTNQYGYDGCSLFIRQEEQQQDGGGVGDTSSGDEPHSSIAHCRVSRTRDKLRTVAARPTDMGEDEEVDGETSAVSGVLYRPADQLLSFPSNGDSGLSSSCYYDAILMDLQMPIMDGLEATRQIRQLEKIKRPETAALPCGSSGKVYLLGDKEYTAAHAVVSRTAPPVSPTRHIATRQLIIGCSANSDSKTMQEAFDVGIDTFLPKPFTLGAFQAIVKQHVSQP